MEFNKGLLITDNPELTKLLLFCIQEDINIYKFFNTEGNNIVVKDNLEADLQEVARQLLAKNIIQVTYEQENSRMSLIRPLYVKGNIEADFDIDQLRGLFTKKYTGQDHRNALAETVNATILDFLGEHYPKYDFDQILEVARETVETLKARDSAYIPNIIKFIKDPKWLLIKLEEKNIKGPTNNYNLMDHE